MTRYGLQMNLTPSNCVIVAYSKLGQKTNDVEFSGENIWPG